VLVEEFLDLAFGQGAGKAVHRLAVHHQDAGRDAADAEGRAQLLLLVGVDLDELEAPGVFHLHFSRIGPSDLQGPHHGAQKSISTGVVMEAATTSASKLAMVTSIMIQ
jgi:hypothetical protein